MMTTSLTRWFCVIAAQMGVLGIFSGPVAAQPRRYVRFEIDPDYEKVLKSRLQLGQFKDLVKKMVADPTNLPIDKKQIEDLKLDNDEFKKAVKDWVDNDPQLKQALVDWMIQNPPDKQVEEVKKLRQDLDEMLKEMPADPIKRVDDAPIITGALPDAPEAPEPESLAAMAERAMRQLGDTKFGDWMGKSPSWKRAFSDLQTSINNPGAMRWRDWQGRLSMPDGGMWKFGQGALDQFKQLPKPDLEGWSLPGIGNAAVPSLGRPVLPDLAGPSLPSLSTGASWFVFGLVVLFVGWHMMRWTQTSRKPRHGHRVQLGPWPVQPSAVSTRAELILAFDYLALWSLGLNVKSWNHRAIARSLSEQAPTLAQFASALAGLYELARYTDGADLLTDAEREQARRSLCQIAEAL